MAFRDAYSTGSDINLLNQIEAGTLHLGGVQTCLTVLAGIDAYLFQPSKPTRQLNRQLNQTGPDRGLPARSPTNSGDQRAPRPG